MVIKKTPLVTSLLCVLISGVALAAGGDMGAGTQPLTDGSESYPWLIEDLADFDTFADPNNAATYWARGVHTQLMTNIDLAGRTYTTAPIAPEVVEIQTAWFDGVSYDGIFDGNDHTINNLIINTDGADNDFLGLFGQVGQINSFGSEVKNLNIEDVTIIGGVDSRFVGGLMGMQWYGEISNCHSTGSIIAFAFVGGLVGHTRYDTIINCSTKVSIVSNGSQIGGLVGTNWWTSITDCHTSGAVSGTHYIGGLVGENNPFPNTTHPSPITDSSATGPVSGTGDYIGGLIGDTNDQVTNCYTTGAVNGINYVGGLLGSGSHTTSCYATGDVTGTGQSVGGLIGRKYGGFSKNCFASGTITGSDIYVGGLVGFNDGYCMINDCFAVGSVSGYEKIGGLVGMNFNNSKIEDSYATGSVIGISSEIGGLVGSNDLSIINNCYATGTATGDDDIGGLVGSNSINSTINSCYASSLVIGNENTGGLLGYNRSNSVSTSFWDTETSGTSDGVGNEDPNPAGVTGKTTAEMMTQSTFSSWDFDPNDGDPADWMMLRELEDYPRLAWQEIFAGDIAGLYGADIVDIAYLGRYWGLDDCNGADDCGRADIDGGGDVGIGDLAAVADDWLKGIGSW